METYGKVLLIAIPIFLILIGIEKWYGWKKGEDTLPFMDMISSLSSGMTNIVKDVLGLSISILTYTWLVNHIAITKVESSFWIYFITFLVLDFQGYWVHRWAHEINFFWNKHAIHHSSEEYNLACALRQSIASFVNIFTFLLIPAALFGIEPKVIAVVAPLHLFAQFWYHTRHIGKMGWFEKIFVTPSHHRVHHAVNKEYMDKNYGQVLIVWDKWFGTYMEETNEIPIRYGISRPARTWNPIKINFQHLWLLAKDAWRTRNWSDKLKIWFMPTGWRPQDVEREYPVAKIENPITYQKYQTPNSTLMQGWIAIQFLFTMLIIFYFLGNIANIGTPNIFLYGLFIFFQIYSYTDLMDMNQNAWVSELLKNAFGIYCLIWSGGTWFGLDAKLPYSGVNMMFYFLVSMIVTIYFVKKETKGLELQPPSSL